MANVIASGTSVVNGTIKRNNFLIGVNTSVQYGPTSATTFWNGIVPATSGYTVYAQKTVNGPSIRTAANDAELITIAKQYGGTNITTIYDALSYFNGQSNFLVTNIDYPSIITSGLTLLYDAGYIPSYPTTGTTCNDLIGTNNGSLLSGATYSSSSGSTFVFNGTSSYISLLNNTTKNFTIGCWIRTTATSLTGTNAWEGNGIVYGDVPGTFNDFVLAILNNRASWFTGNPDSSINGTTTINTGAWFYLTVTKNGDASTKQLYVNGVSEASGSSNANILNANPNIAIGGNVGDTKMFNGNIANLQTYNRVLSSTEILQNYNAQKSRFGL